MSSLQIDYTNADMTTAHHSSRPAGSALAAGDVVCKHAGSVRSADQTAWPAAPNGIEAGITVFSPA